MMVLVLDYPVFKRNIKLFNWLEKLVTTSLGELVVVSK